VRARAPRGREASSAPATPPRGQRAREREKEKGMEEGEEGSEQGVAASKVQIYKKKSPFAERFASSNYFPHATPREAKQSKP